MSRTRCCWPPSSTRWRKLRGTYGLVILFRDYPDLIVAARQGSPLVVGVGDGEHFVASDASPLAGRADKIVYLADHQIAVVTADSLEVTHREQGRIEHLVHDLAIEETDVELGGFPHYMLKEIFEQPEALENAMRGRLSDEDATRQVRRPEPHAAAAARHQPDHPHRLRHELARGAGRRIPDRGAGPHSGRSRIRQRAALSQSAASIRARCCSRSRKAAKRPTRWPPCAK